MNKKTEDYISDVLCELKRAEKLFPVYPEEIEHGILILNEEIGELNRAILDFKNVKEIFVKREHPNIKYLKDIRTEAIQSAAMALRFLKNFDKRFQLKTRGE